MARPTSRTCRAREALAAGLLTGLASDYHPPSLLAAAYQVADAGLCSWAEGMGLCTSGPAGMAGLDDRGRIAPRLRADLVAVGRLSGPGVRGCSPGGQPVVRQTWVDGRPVLGLVPVEVA